MNIDRATDEASSRDDESDGIRIAATDGHRYRLLLCAPSSPRATVLWLPALGVAARHYLPFADALAACGFAVLVHEWRGHGSSSLRANRATNWGYRELLEIDLPASVAAIRERFPQTSRIVGGHSLGAQLAACLLALRPDAAQRLWLVASGSPFWRVFPAPRGWLLPLAYRFLPWLADRAGALPGRAIGFGGKEARGVMHDWARTALSGRYAGAGVSVDLETALHGVNAPANAVLLADDWWAPPSSLAWLMAKMPRSAPTLRMLDAAALGARADHFGWMRRPEAVAQALARSALGPASADDASVSI
jgi:predicted alpha/beta hydrolase